MDNSAFRDEKFENDIERTQSPDTSTNFLKAIKLTTDQNLYLKKNSLTSSTQSIQVAEIEGLESNKLSDPLHLLTNSKSNENANREELRQDIIYNPCQLDFKIAAQLIQDAIHGTDIDFKHSEIGLK